MQPGRAGRFFTPKDVELALSEISAKDRIMAALVERVGVCQIPQGSDPFSDLVESMVYQQVTGKAAAAIFSKLLSETSGVLSPDRIMSLSHDQMKNAGLSRQKISYILDLSERVKSGALNLREISFKDDNTVIEELTEVKGIGIWTAQMFLIFTLGRLDVFPSGDLGIKRAMEKHYAIRGELTEKKMQRIALNWAPYRTIGTLMLWKSENTKLLQPS